MLYFCHFLSPWEPTSCLLFSSFPYTSCLLFSRVSSLLSPSTIKAYCVVLENNYSYSPHRGFFFYLSPNSSGNSSLDSYFPLRMLAFKTTLLLRIFSDPLWWGYGYFLEPDIQSHVKIQKQQISYLFHLLTGAYLLGPQSATVWSRHISQDAF